jgi:hypothetical protein
MRNKYAGYCPKTLKADIKKPPPKGAVD